MKNLLNVWELAKRYNQCKQQKGFETNEIVISFCTFLNRLLFDSMKKFICNDKTKTNKNKEKTE